MTDFLRTTPHFCIIFRKSWLQILAWRQTIQKVFFYLPQYFEAYTGIVSQDMLQPLLPVRHSIIWCNAAYTVRKHVTQYPKYQSPFCSICLAIRALLPTYQQVQPSCQLLSVPSCSALVTLQHVCRIDGSVQPPDGSRSGCVSWSSGVHFSPILPTVM